MTIQVGSTVKYDPDGLIMPISDDECQNGLCVGEVTESDFSDEAGIGPHFLVNWSKVCKLHDELSTGHQVPSWERSGDLALNPQ